MHWLFNIHHSGWVGFESTFGFELVGFRFGFGFKIKGVDSDADSDSSQNGRIRIQIRGSRIRTSLIRALPKDVLNVSHYTLEHPYVGQP